MAHDSQSIRSGAPITALSASTLTASYQYTNPIDLRSYDSIVVMIGLNTAQAGTTANLKFQWSSDNLDNNTTFPSTTSVTNWYDEADTDTPVVSGTESSRTVYSYVVNFSMVSGSPNIVSRFRRQGRYFRIGYKSSGTTTGKIVLTAIPMCNQN